MWNYFMTTPYLKFFSARKQKTKVVFPVEFFLLFNFLPAGWVCFKHFLQRCWKGVKGDYQNEIFKTIWSVLWFLAWKIGFLLFSIFLYVHRYLRIQFDMITYYDLHCKLIINRILNFVISEIAQILCQPENRSHMQCATLDKNRK